MTTNEQFKKAFVTSFSLDQVSFLAKASERTIRLKETGITSRVFNHWKKLGLLLSGAEISEKRKWEILSFIDIIWLGCVQELRDLRVSLESIKRIKEVLLSPLDPSIIIEMIDRELNKNTSGKINELIHLFLPAIEKLELDAEQKQLIIAQLSTKEFYRDLIKNRPITFIDTMLMNAVIYKSEVGIYMFSDGEIVPFLKNEVNVLNSNNERLHDSHLYTSLTKQIFKFLNDSTKAEYVAQYELLTKAEVEMITYLREKGFSEVTFKNEETYYLVTAERKVPIPEGKYHEIKKEMKFKIDFGEIREVIHDRKVKSLSITIKKRIRK